MALAFVTLFTLFAMFCAGRMVRALIIPATIIMTLVYLLFWAGVFNTTVDAKKTHQPISQRNAGP